MADNNVTDITEEKQRKKCRFNNVISSPSVMGSSIGQGLTATGNLPKGIFVKRKRGRSATKHKKQKIQTKGLRG